MPIASASAPEIRNSHIAEACRYPPVGRRGAAFGFAHRRLKRWLVAKPLYLTLAWTAVAVALPAAHDPAARHVGWAAAVVATAVLANVALSNLRDAEGLAGRHGRATPRLARRTAPTRGGGRCHTSTRVR